MSDLSVKIAGIEFNNPLIAASGTFGFGREYGELYPLEKLGGQKVSFANLVHFAFHHHDVVVGGSEIGRASCRERV